MVVDNKDANASKVRSHAQNWTDGRVQLDESKIFGKLDDRARASIEESWGTI
jgi:hypothetical protein